jgi:hypothetical protein
MVASTFAFLIELSNLLKVSHAGSKLLYQAWDMNRKNSCPSQPISHNGKIGSSCHISAMELNDI